jgi:isopentenyl diphosphate isomerase/L-lactate dehydrogenase-like FMN-dependent dehydrogenase
MLELQQLAEQKNPREVWDYAVGGSASETTLRRNRAALDRLAIEQRVLVDVRSVDLSTELLGMSLPMPLLVAPMGSLYRFCPEGDIEIARGANSRGVPATVSGVCGWPMEQIATASGGPLLFQLYFHGNREWAAARLDRVQSRPEYKAICLTVDVATYSRRDRDIVNRYGARSSTSRDGLPEPHGPNADYPAGLTWDDVAWLRQQVRLPFGLKGIAHPDDALRALDYGCDFIWVSNHGGRQLDSGRATIDSLQRVAAVVQGRAPIIVDGGFQRGTDVLKGIALGASAVAMGKACAWGLMAGGAEGTAAMLQIIHEELRIAMALSGHTALAQLGPDSVGVVEY